MEFLLGLVGGFCLALILSLPDSSARSRAMEGFMAKHRLGEYTNHPENPWRYPEQHPEWRPSEVRNEDKCATCGVRRAEHHEFVPTYRPEEPVGSPQREGE